MNFSKIIPLIEKLPFLLLFSVILSCEKKGAIQEKAPFEMIKGAWSSGGDDGDAYVMYYFEEDSSYLSIVARNADDIDECTGEWHSMDNVIYSYEDSLKILLGSNDEFEEKTKSYAYGDKSFLPDGSSIETGAVFRFGKKREASGLVFYYIKEIDEIFIDHGDYTDSLKRIKSIEEPDK